MATKTLDPLGVCAERIRLNAALSTLASQISAWTGDRNGLADLQLRAGEINYRVNAAASGYTSSSPWYGLGNGGSTAPTAFSGFGLEVSST